MRNLIFSSLLFISCYTFSQTNYPTDYFEPPLEIPLYLSGTFGELRSNHFHSGIDFKTQQKEGFNILASAAGYVSRIKISHWGYGKALYITHPNGYVTVYAHLKKFSPKIEAYIKQKQYEQKTFEIQVFPEAGQLQVDQKEIIAYSGSTGGFVGPHLHFEIRDSAARPINPFLFGITVKDTQKPTIQTLVAYPLTDSAQINQSNKPLKINFKQKEDGKLYANQVFAHGDISFGINTFDRLNGALNKNGVYSIDLKVNNHKTYQHKLDRFSFSETKYINLLIDYKRYKNLNQRIQQCFLVHDNPLSIYGEVINNGIINIEDGYDYTIEITVKDYAGNNKQLVIPIKGKKDIITRVKKVNKTPYYIPLNEYKKFQIDDFSIAIAKNTFYENCYLEIHKKDSLIDLSPKNLLVKKKFTLTFDVSKYDEKTKKYMFIAKRTNKGNTYHVKTHKKSNSFYTTTKDLGIFTLLCDSIAPKIKLSNFYNGQWMTNFKKLEVKIYDNLSGIKSYKAEIDGDWVLMEYNPKYQTLTYNFDDKKFVNAKHQLKIVVEDKVGNTNTKEVTFYRKK